LAEVGPGGDVPAPPPPAETEPAAAATAGLGRAEEPDTPLRPEPAFADACPPGLPPAGRLAKSIALPEVGDPEPEGVPDGLPGGGEGLLGGVPLNPLVVIPPKLEGTGPPGEPLDAPPPEEGPAPKPAPWPAGGEPAHGVPDCELARGSRVRMRGCVGWPEGPEDVLPKFPPEDGAGEGIDPVPVGAPIPAGGAVELVGMAIWLAGWEAGLATEELPPGAREAGTPLLLLPATGVVRGAPWPGWGCTGSDWG
jgi:hypothetical protein